MIDSQRFLSDVEFLQSRGPAAFSSFYNYQYLSYIGLIAVIFEAGGVLEHVVFLQLLFSLFATVALYKSALIISGSRLTSFLSCLFFLFWVELQSWNFYVLTESLYVSCSVLCFFLMLKTKDDGRYGIMLLPFLLFTIFIRPHGIVFLLASAVFFFKCFAESAFYKKHKILVLTTVIFAFSLLVVLTAIALEDFNFMSVQVYTTGDIVYGASTFASEHEIISLYSGSLHLPDPELPTALQVMQFVVYNPWYFIRLSLGKLLIFFAHIKPYYSVVHNLLIAFSLYPLYLFFIAGIRKAKSSPSKFFVISLVVLQAISVMFTVEDWDGRFLMPILPFIMMFAAIGISFQIKKSLFVNKKWKEFRSAGGESKIQESKISS